MHGYLFWITALFLLCGTNEGCIEISQICYKCRGDISVCPDGSFSYTTAQECIDLIEATPTSRSAHYKPDNDKCFPYTCANNLFFSDSTRFSIRKTCNGDCTSFTLTFHDEKRITNTPVSTPYYASRGQCFEDCFETYGCYSFAYDSYTGYCSLYTICGQSCNMVYHSGGEVYTRTCHTVTDCGSLSAPTNGQVVTSSGTTYLNTATYTCSTGFVLNGSSSRTCQANEQWSGSAPTCATTDCGSLTSPSNGAVDTSSGTTYNNQATYSCSTGYNLSGGSTRTCQADGEWSGSMPSCVLVNCGSLFAPSNGAVDTSSGTSYNDQATYSCSTGYNLSGSSTTTCQADGQWSNSMPSCVAVNCGSLSSPSNGAVDTSSGTSYNDQATYSCSTGYNLSGSSTTTCQADGQWSNSMPSCVAVNCGSLSSPSNGAVDTSSGTSFNDQATYSCSTGYNLSGSSTTTCQADGQWSNSMPSCVAVNCGSLSSPSNGAVDTSSGTSYNDQAIYSCSTGYNLSGSSTTTCQADGQWSNSMPSCVAVNCGSLSSPSNGAVDTSSGTSFNDQATYSCSTGYNLSGSSTTTCQADGQWSISMPSCVAVNCGSLSTPSNGAVDTSSGTSYNDQATYSCSTGYNLSGSSTTTCQADGQWSNSMPSCVAVNCGSLSSPSNGAVDTSSGTSFNDQATYSCSTGYNLSGSSTTTCQADGQWSNSMPSCVAVNCGSLFPPTNGAVDTSSGTSFNAVATYTCAIGYNLTGSASRTCQANTLWSGGEPTCSFNGCGTLSAPTNGYVDTSNGTLLGDEATYSCEDGHILNGTSKRFCQGDAQWSDTQPNCTAKDCGPLNSPLNGVVDTSTGTTFSSQALYTCLAGYNLQGNTNRTCESSGNWNGTTPSCNIVNCGNLSAQGNVDVENPTDTVYLEEALYTCLAGYYLIGSNTSTCQANGTWSGAEPVCVPVDCGTLATPSNGKVTHNGTVYGDTALFECDNGFSLSGSAVSTCTANGVWDSLPTCSLTDCGSLVSPDNGVINYPYGTTYGGVAYFQCHTGYYLSHAYNRTCQSDGFWSMSTPICVQNGVPIPEVKKLYIAPCLCITNKTFTNMTQDEIIEFLIEATRIPTNSTALARSKYTSAKDPRASSKVIGCAGLSIILVSLGLVLVSDILIFWQKWDQRNLLYTEEDSYK